MQIRIPNWLPDFKLTYPSSKPFPKNWKYFSLITYSVAAVIFVLLVVLNGE